MSVERSISWPHFTCLHPKPLFFFLHTLVAFRYDEVSSYAFSSNPWSDNRGNFEAIGHFTQLVWIGSTTMGCAMSSSSCNGYSNWYVVCNYDPPGNVADDAAFYANVKPRSA